MMSQFEMRYFIYHIQAFIVFPTTNILFMMYMATSLELLNIKRTSYCFHKFVFLWKGHAMLTFSKPAEMNYKYLSYDLHI